MKTAAARITIVLITTLLLAFAIDSHKPVLYIIGDSTVKNGDGSGRNSQWGWASVIAPFFDTARIEVQNHAIGGRSSRTFITDGRWDRILQTLHKGDYVMMQFGHNDSSPLDDTARARGTIKGIGEDSIDTYNPIRKMRETVYSYGHYMRKFIRETQARGAVAIVCSPVPRDNWKDGKIVRTEYATWSRQVAEETGAAFLDLHERVAKQYEAMDTARVHAFFPADHTHTNKEGALLNAQQVVNGIRDLNNTELKKYLR